MLLFTITYIYVTFAASLFITTFFIVISLLITGNNPEKFPKKTLVTFLCVSFIYSLLSVSGLLYFPTGAPFTVPYSYAVPPYIYNTITQFIAPAVLIFILLLAISCFFKLKRPFLFAILATILIAPWFELKGIIKPSRSWADDGTISPFVSRKKMDEFAKQIKVEYLNERVYFLGEANSAVLEIEAHLSVPASGMYFVTPDYTDKRFFLMSPDGKSEYGELYVNREADFEEKGLHLEKGNNLVTFTFPFYLFDQNKKDAQNQPKLRGINSIFSYNPASEDLGPYRFQFGIHKYVNNETRYSYEFKYVSDEYLTKQYHHKEFKLDPEISRSRTDKTQ